MHWMSLAALLFVGAPAMAHDDHGALEQRVKELEAEVAALKALVESQHATASSADVPAVVPADKGLVQHQGDGRVWLVNDSGRFKAGLLDPGTYETVVFFVDNSPLQTASFTIAGGETIVVSCAVTEQACTTKKLGAP